MDRVGLIAATGTGADSVDITEDGLSAWGLTAGLGADYILYNPKLSGRPVEAA